MCLKPFIYKARREMLYQSNTALKFLMPKH